MHNTKSPKLEPEIERMIADRTNARTRGILAPIKDTPASLRKAIRQFRKDKAFGKIKPDNGTPL
jgi:hypothetical protein